MNFSDITKTNRYQTASKYCYFITQRKKLFSQTNQVFKNSMILWCARRNSLRNKENADFVVFFAKNQNKK